MATAKALRDKLLRLRGDDRAKDWRKWSSSKFWNHADELAQRDPEAAAIVHSVKAHAAAVERVGQRLDARNPTIDATGDRASAGRWAAIGLRLGMTPDEVKEKAIPELLGYLDALDASDKPAPNWTGPIQKRNLKATLRMNDRQFAAWLNAHKAALRSSARAQSATTAKSIEVNLSAPVLPANHRALIAELLGRRAGIK